MQHVDYHTTEAPARPGQLGLREALGPGFAVVGPTEATLATVSGRVRHRHGRPVRN